MSAFIAGIIFGALFMGAVFVLFATRSQRPRRKREPAEWNVEFHEPPPVKTRMIIQERTIDL